LKEVDPRALRMIKRILMMVMTEKMMERATTQIYLARRNHRSMTIGVKQMMVMKLKRRKNLKMTTMEESQKRRRK